MNKLLIQWVLGIALCLGCSAQCAAAERVLIVHSHGPDSVWAGQINAALEPQLNGASIPYRMFFMDTDRKSDSASKLKAAQRARRLIRSYRPRVLIAIDDVAQAYVARNFIGDPSLQIVFAGVNADPEFFDYPAPNAIGILERTYPGQVLDMLKVIAPHAKRVVWISDDSATANLVMARVRRKSESGKLPLPIAAFVQPATFRRWQAAIRKFDADPDIGGLLIPLYHTVKTRIDGPSVVPADVMKWTIEHTQKPIVGLWPFSTDDGAVCVVSVDPKEHGKVAAMMAKEILAGKAASALPLMVNQDGFVVFNIPAAIRLNLQVPFEMLLSADKVIE